MENENIPVLYVIVYCQGNTVGMKIISKITSKQWDKIYIHKKMYDSFKVGQKQFYSYHLMVYLRLGWLTVLSSRNMVEHELYFRLIGPGWCCDTNTHTHMLAQRAKSPHPSISICVHAGTDHGAWWQPENVGHLKVCKPILSSHCWCLRWEHAGLAYVKGHPKRHKFTITPVAMKTSLY